MAGRQTVILGAGVVGAVLTDELSALGWTDIGCFDRRIPAIVTPEPLFDPKMSRLRG